MNNSIEQQLEILKRQNEALMAKINSLDNTFSEPQVLSSRRTSVISILSTSTRKTTVATMRVCASYQLQYNFAYKDIPKNILFKIIEKFKLRTKDLGVQFGYNDWFVYELLKKHVQHVRDHKFKMKNGYFKKNKNEEEERNEEEDKNEDVVHEKQEEEDENIIHEQDEKHRESYFSSDLR
ncbi:hypothetical protein GLOIN_2v1791560 [Rhizophagus clarus]|uniref:Uncharacterized protein n=1 Tax=Rhizophagus clarus TaxID=94130 RepID=A0A8H3LBA4_9GLOM|nr:hypothetical protein GLOIN_2v1791560 [Rhizophagus clarus]